MPRNRPKYPFANHPQWISKHFVKARKAHTCSCCHTTITPGSYYYRQTITPWMNADNDGFGTFKAHPECVQMWYDDASDYFDNTLPYDAYEWEEYLNLPS